MEEEVQGDRDLRYAEEVLNSDHYGLEKIKERILEFLAVRAWSRTPRVDPLFRRASRRR